MNTERVEIVTLGALKYYLDNAYDKYKSNRIIFLAIYNGIYVDALIRIKHILSNGAKDEFIACIKDTDWSTGHCSLTNIVDAFPHSFDKYGNNIVMFVERVKLVPETKTEANYTVLDITCKDSDDINIDLTKKELLRSAIHDIAPTITVGQIENIFDAIKEIYNIELK